MTSKTLFPTLEQKRDYIVKELDNLSNIINENAFIMINDIHSSKFYTDNFKGCLEDLLRLEYSKTEGDFFTVWSKFDDESSVSTNITEDKRKKSLAITFVY